MPETSGPERGLELADLVLDEASYQQQNGQASPEEQQLQEEEEEDEEEEPEEEEGDQGDENLELVERNLRDDIGRPQRQIQQEMFLTNPFSNVHLAYASSMRQLLERSTPFQRHPISCPFAIQQYRRCFPVQNAIAVTPRYVPFIESPLILHVYCISTTLSFCSVDPKILSQFLIQQLAKELRFHPFQTKGGEDR